MRAMRFLFWFISVLAYNGASQADTFTYHALSTLRLGGTFDPYDLTRPRPPCLKESTEVGVDGMNGKLSAPDMKFFIKQVTDRRELNSLLSQSISISGHYSLFAADGSYSQQDEVHSTADSVSWVLGVTARYGKFRLSETLLNDVAASLARTDMEALINRCGPSVVMQVTRGISIGVIITIQESSRTEKQNTQAGISASASGSLWGISASAEGKEQLETALKSGLASIDVQVAGGPGAPGMAALIKALKGASSIDEMKKVLSDYVAVMGAEWAVPLEFETTNLSDFIPELALPDFSAYEELIGEFYLALQQNKYYNRKYINFLVHAIDYDPSIPAIQAAKSGLEKVRANMADIQTASRACRKLFYDARDASLSAQNDARHTSRRGVDSARKRAVSALRKLGEGAMKLVSSSRRQDSLPGSAHLVAAQDMVAFIDDRDELEGGRDCKFDPAWLNFSEAPNIPKFPFTYSAFMDDLGQAPSMFLYLEVKKNTLIDFVEIVGGAQSTLLRLPVNSSGDWSGALDLTSPGISRPVAGRVVMRSGNSYLIPLAN